MDIKFNKGDLIILKNDDEYSSEYLYSDIKIYKVVSVSGPKLKLSGIKGDVAVTNILPVPINGIDDRMIYYAPVIAAPYVGANEEVPVYRTDYSYYMDAFKRTNVSWKEQTLYELVQKENFQYVHEIQAYLNELFNRDDLKINKMKH